MVGQIANHPPLGRRGESQYGGSGQDPLLFGQAGMLLGVDDLQVVSARQQGLAECPQVRLGGLGPLGLPGYVQAEGKPGHDLAQGRGPGARSRPRRRSSRSVASKRPPSVATRPARDASIIICRTAITKRNHCGV